MSRHRITNGFCAHTHTQAHTRVCTHTQANTHARVGSHTRCYPFLPFRPTSLEVGNGYSFFWACETNTEEKSAHTRTFSPISCANVCTLPLKEREGDGAVCEAAWERRLAGWDGGGCLTSGQGEMHLSPSNPRAASSGVPRYHLHVPAPPHLRVFKRPWFGQLLKHKEVLERRTRGGVGGGRPSQRARVALSPGVITRREVGRQLGIWGPARRERALTHRVLETVLLPALGSCMAHVLRRSRPRTHSVLFKRCRVRACMCACEDAWLGVGLGATGATCPLLLVCLRSRGDAPHCPGPPRGQQSTAQGGKLSVLCFGAGSCRERRTEVLPKGTTATGLTVVTWAL